jgi:hypothetical protein
MNETNCKLIDVTNIRYDLDGINGFEHYVHNNETKEQVLSNLPTKHQVLLCESEYEEQSEVLGIVQKELESAFGWLVTGFHAHFDGQDLILDEEPYAIKRKKLMKILGASKVEF